MVDENFSKAQTEVFAKHQLAARQEWVEVPVIEGRAHVLVEGEGPPVVYFNGVGVPGAMFAPLMTRVDGVKQFAIDLPGFGLTDTRPDFAVDLRANAVEFVIQTLDALELERPTIVANSFGSLISSWVAIDRPERVRALAHVGCPALALDTSAPLPMRLLSTRVGPLMMKLQPASRGQVEQLSKMVNEYPLPDEIAELILATEQLDHFNQTFQTTLRRLLRLRGSKPDMRLTAEHLAKIEVPTLLVFGRNDPMGAADVGQAVAACMQHAELHVVDGGHAPWIHHSDQIAPLLHRFLHET